MAPFTLAGNLAATLFGLGFVGAALLAAAIVPLSTAYSVSEVFAAPADVNDTPKEAPLFYASFVLMVVVAAALVLIPGAPLIPILFLSQALNAVLLLVLLPLMRRLARDPAVMGPHVIARTGRRVSGCARRTDRGVEREAASRFGLPLM
jgi:Mn2+/Fe2+ NRAMP family transporter